MIGVAKAPMKQAELHLVLVWSKALYKLTAIEEDIRKNFVIADIFNVVWDADLFSENLTRFYGQSLPPDSFKEQHCGNGPFTLFVVVDKNPRYGFRRTSRGTEYVNTNLFDAKQRYRELTGGGHKIHTTNTVRECRHDLYLLLGKTYQATLQAYLRGEQRPVATPTDLHRNVSGHGGWKDLAQLFEALNECLDYVVLRNFEYLPYAFSSELHGDIDFLVDNVFNAVCIMDADHTGGYKDSRHFVTIGGKRLPVDLLYVGDGYYDSAWAEDILDDRILNDKGIHVPSPEHQYYALSYHVFHHKRAISADYPQELQKRAADIGMAGNDDDNLDVHFLRLQTYLSNNEYAITTPVDATAEHDRRFFFRNRTVTRELARAGFVEPTIIKTAQAKKNFLSTKQIYFKARCVKDGSTVFVKWNGEAKLLEHEFFILQRCNEACPAHFPKPLFCGGGKYPFLAMEFLEGTEACTSLDPGAVVAALCAISDTLNTCRIVHRTISPANLVFAKNSLCLVDFKLAFDAAHDILPERDLFRTNNRRFYDAISQFCPEAMTWDDAHALFVIACQQYDIPVSGLRELRNRIGRLRLSLS